MRILKASVARGLVAASVLATLAASEQAAAQPLPTAPILAAHSNTSVTDVYWRHGGWGWPFWAAPAIVGGIIVGGVLTANAVAEHRADRLAMQHCADDFPNFNWRTGTFINRRGEERVCPYLQ